MTFPVLDATPLWLRRFTKFVAASTLFLIFAGAMVTSTNSGLSVPDWPLSYGKLMPPMIGGIFYEHGHRMIASLVGFLTLLQAFFLQRREPKSFLRKLGWTSLGVVILQGVFGGLTVLLHLPKSVSVAHAGLAEIFLCLNVSIAFFASSSYATMRRSEQRSISPWFAATLLVVAYLQIVIGAVMRHMGAGLAIPDFPLSNGAIVPAFLTSGIAVAYAHRVGALVLTLLAMTGAVAAFRSTSRPLRLTYSFLTLVIAIQVTLGALTIWSGRHPVVTSFHVVTGALVLSVTLVQALIAATVARREPAVVLQPSEVSA